MQKGDDMNRLPTDVIRLIFFQTSKHDGLTFRLVCKRFLRLCMDLPSLPWWQRCWKGWVTNSTTPEKCVIALCIESYNRREKVFNEANSMFEREMDRLKSHQSNIAHAQYLIERRQKTLSWHKKKRDGEYQYPYAVSRHKKYIGKKTQQLSALKARTSQFQKKISPLRQQAKQSYLRLAKCQRYMYNINKVR